MEWKLPADRNKPLLKPIVSPGRNGGRILASDECVYIFGIVTGILMRLCWTSCRSRNTTASSCNTIALNSRPQSTLRRSAEARSSAEAQESHNSAFEKHYAVQYVEKPAGDVVYWCGGREMYHCKQECPVLVGVARGRTIRNRDVCQVVYPRLNQLYCDSC